MKTETNNTYQRRIANLLETKNKEELHLMLSKNIGSFNICVFVKLNPWEKQIWIDLGLDIYKLNN